MWKMDRAVTTYDQTSGKLAVFLRKPSPDNCLISACSICVVTFWVEFVAMCVKWAVTYDQKTGTPAVFLRKLSPAIARVHVVPG